MKRIVDNTLKNITGSEIKRYREAAGMTQAELSHRLEVNAVYVCRGSISRIEQGVRIVSDIELKGISNVLNVPIGAFFQEQQT